MFAAKWGFVRIRMRRARNVTVFEYVYAKRLATIVASDTTLF